jgi:hypothetical protein
MLTQIEQTLHTQPAVTCSNNQTNKIPSLPQL